jgi:hypothetical protein
VGQAGAGSGKTSQLGAEKIHVMKRNWIVIAILAIVAWWYFNREVEHLAEPPSAVVKPIAIAPPQSEREPAPGPQEIESKTVTNSVKVEPPKLLSVPNPPPGGLVEFERKLGGLAVAYGDVVMGKIQGDQAAARGYAKPTRPRLWPSNQIAYSIKPGLPNEAAILEALEYFNKNTNVRFTPLTDQVDSIVFVAGDDLCASYLGRIGGAQPIFVSPKCGAHEVMHEIMHALGFVHEHSRVDRDKHLEVMWRNIDSKFWLQFWMVSDEEVHDYVGSVFNFDSESIMLYEPTAFALAPGTVTLRSRTGQELRPSHQTLSRTDRERIQYLYGN